MGILYTTCENDVHANRSIHGRRGKFQFAICKDDHLLSIYMMRDCAVFQQAL